VAVEVPSLGGLFLYPFAHLSLLDLHGRVRVDVSPRGGPVHIESNTARVSGWRGWVASGVTNTAHYNPENTRKVVLVTPDARLWGPQTPTNLRLLGLFAAGCLLTLAIARVRLR
jgi:hypothetical protein